MQYKGYTAVIETEEDGTLHARIAGIRDIVCAVGANMQELEQAFRDSVDEYLAYCVEQGEKPCDPSGA